MVEKEEKEEEEKEEEENEDEEKEEEEDEDEDKRKTGHVKWFDRKKGFGFIIDEDGNDIFVHYSALQGRDDDYKTLNENDKVEFEVVQAEKGPQAKNVEILQKAPSNPYGTSGYKI